ncbi:MAG: glycosyltransferase family 4 protein [Candidatus Dormibacteria bacterium]
MTRVLWVTAEPPDFSRSGGSIRQAQLLRALAKRADIHLLVAGRVQDEHVRTGLSEVTEVAAPGADVRHSRTWWRMQRLRGALLESDPHEVVVSRAVRASLAAGLAGVDDHDITIVEHTWLAGLLGRGRAGAWMIDLQQLALRQAEQALRAATRRRTRVINALEVTRARRHEAWIAASYDRVFVASAQDQANFPGSSVVVPNGADLAAYPKGWRAAPDPDSMLFVGHLAYLPNVEGLIWFCHRVLPLVRARRPRAQLQVIGREPVPEVMALARLAGVSVAPEAPEIRPYLAAAALEVVPLMVGSGTRLKALEALAAGVPLVGTTVGLEGLDLVHGETAMIADTAEDMAAAVVRVLEDRATATGLASAGRTHVEERFGWETIGKSFTDAVLAPATSR